MPSLRTGTKIQSGTHPLRKGIFIVVTASCRRFEKGIGDLELKKLLIVILVGGNFVHGTHSPTK
jgi:hypothetical protein